MMNKLLLQDKEKLHLYHQSALKSLQKKHEFRKNHQQKSLYLAKQAAIILKEKFSVSKVALFGSILDIETFTQWSDIDIAVWGLDSSQTLIAMEAVQNLSDTIEINLVDINTVKPEVYKNILKTHQEI